MADLDKFQEYYINAYQDILAGRNLEKRQLDIKGAIAEIDISIENHRAQHKDEPTSLLALKNELYRLKYLILEQI